MRRLGVVGIVLVGLGITAQGISSTAYPITMLVSLEVGPQLVAFALVLLIPVVLVGMGSYLIANRHRLAERWFDDEDVVLPDGGAALLRVGLIVVGVVVLVDAIPILLSLPASWVAQAALTRASFGDSSVADYGPFASFLLRLVPVLARVAIGVALVAGSDRIAARLWAGAPLTSSSADSEGQAACPSCGVPYDPGDYFGGLVPARCTSCGELLEGPGSRDTPESGT